MQEPDPPLGAALHELNALDPRERPMLAAHWLARGLDSPSLRELAGLHGEEAEVNDYWHRALEELGVLPLERPRTIAAPWAAQRVLHGQQSVQWLLNLLWPSGDDEIPHEEPLDRIIYALDELVSVWSSVAETLPPRPGLLRRRRVETEAKRARDELERADRAVQALAADDLQRAERVLSPHA
ncbi:hypothetical protein [Motilibacter deserti]|uniref:Uncharacterized protein n=1 Tax=Motilibacter deserti TaxID=2714956 RepID=A0ABX0GZP1_9ACTN|nr:hypothetical protein [Motilibacter deserti]NHC15136.1 hypothetical protein [Motilibacter deserti]